MMIGDWENATGCGYACMHWVNEHDYDLGKCEMDCDRYDYEMWGLM